MEFYNNNVWFDNKDTFECEELNKKKLSDWGDSILYAANREPDALEKATEQALLLVEEWKKQKNKNIHIKSKSRN